MPNANSQDVQNLELPIGTLPVEQDGEEYLDAQAKDSRSRKTRRQGDKSSDKQVDSAPSQTGLFIAQERNRLKLSQRSLAKRIGVSEPTVANWEQGRVSLIWLERARKLCLSLDVELDELIPDVEPLLASEEDCRNEMKTLLDNWSFVDNKKSNVTPKQSAHDQHHVGRVIAVKRDAKKLTQRDLAEKIGVSEGTVAGWESGAIQMQWLERTKRLCTVLEISLAELAPNIKPKVIRKEMELLKQAIAKKDTEAIEYFRRMV